MVGALAARSTGGHVGRTASVRDPDGAVIGSVASVLPVGPTVGLGQRIDEVWIQVAMENVVWRHRNRSAIVSQASFH